jgi:hypothetical protein
MRDKVLHPYKTTVEVVVLYSVAISKLSFSDSRLEEQRF